MNTDATTNECYKERALQWTVFINKIRLQQRMNATMDGCCNEQFLSIKSGCNNEHRCYNERGGILSVNTACACEWHVGPSRFD